MPSVISAFPFDDPISLIEQEVLLLDVAIKKLHDITSRVENFFIDPWSVYSISRLTCSGNNTLAASIAQDVEIDVTLTELTKALAAYCMRPIEFSDDNITLTIAQTGPPQLQISSDGVRQRMGALFAIMPVSIAYGTTLLNYGLSLEVGPYVTSESGRIIIAYTAAPRFIDVSKRYSDPVSLAPTGNAVRDNMRKSLYKEIASALNKVEITPKLPEQVMHIAPSIAVFSVNFVGIMRGITVNCQGLGPNRGNMYHSGNLDSPYEVGISLHPRYLERILTDQLQERHAVLTRLSFSGGVVSFDCYYVDRTTFQGDGATGYVDIRIEWTYNVAFEQPVENGWTVRSRASRVALSDSYDCEGFLCETLIQGAVQQAKDKLSDTLDVTTHFLDLSQTAKKSSVHVNPTCLMIDFEEL